MPFYGLSIAGYLVPNIFGLADGGMKFGDAIAAGAQIATTAAELLSQSAALAETVAQHQRRASEWELQQQLASYEVAELSKQIAAAQARIVAAEQELAINLREVANAGQIEALMRSSFTNQELYAWMTGRVASVYFQAYRLAQELALAAQSAYQFELDREEQLVVLGGWDDLHRGLTAGESLKLSLEQLRKAYLDNDTRRLEIEKTISLRQSFPLAFAGFKWGHPITGAQSGRGQLDFTLSQALFDFDYPSHYNRKIKSISISLPSVIGPYQDFHLTLTQNTNMIVLEPNPRAVEYAVELTVTPSQQKGESPPAGSVRENWTPNQSIAVSRGIDDAGVFQLDFHDERYLPFEGTGAVSSWTLSMPPETNRIDFDNISDIVVKIRYTAREGGVEFGSLVKRLYAQGGERYAYLNASSFYLSQTFSAQWSQLFATPPVEGKQTILLPIGASAMLPNLASVKLHGVLLQLDLAAESVVSSQPQKPFCTLRANGHPTTPVGVPVTENVGEVPAGEVPSLGESFAGVTWEMQFDTSLTPSELKDAAGALDPTKLLDVAFVIVYSAGPFAT
jgi:hypothetical protein